MNARDWKYFLIAWGFVLLAAFTPLAFGQEVFKVGMDVDMVSMSSCNTPEQAKDVASQPTFEKVKERLIHFYKVGENGTPVCGNLGGFRATIVSLHGTYTIEGQEVTVFGFMPHGTTRVFFGVTTLPFERV